MAGSPQSTWITDPYDKQALIEDYKWVAGIAPNLIARSNMSGIDCKYYRRGDGACPFGDSCFYRHVDKVR